MPWPRNLGTWPVLLPAGAEAGGGRHITHRPNLSSLTSWAGLLKRARLKLVWGNRARRPTGAKGSVHILKSVWSVRSRACTSEQRVGCCNAFPCQYWTSREKWKDNSAVLFINSSTEVTFSPRVGSLVCVQELCKNDRMKQCSVGGLGKGEGGGGVVKLWCGFFLSLSVTLWDRALFHIYFNSRETGDEKSQTSVGGGDPWGWLTSA